MKLRRSKLLKDTRIEEASYIEMFDHPRGVRVRIQFFEGAVEKHITFIFGTNNLSCISREIRKVLREKRDELGIIIEQVQEKV